MISPAALILDELDFTLQAAVDGLDSSFNHLISVLSMEARTREPSKPPSPANDEEDNEVVVRGLKHQIGVKKNVAVDEREHLLLLFCGVHLGFCMPRAPVFNPSKNSCRWICIRW